MVLVSGCSKCNGVRVECSKVKATKQLDLSGETCRQIVKSEKKLALRTYVETFKKIADQMFCMKKIVSQSE
ncbi:MAG: hypothetical protein WA154_00895 [Moraxellaceae bacterium]